MIEHEVARALLEIDAVGFSAGAPIRFRSGILSPVYVDNRRLPFHPAQWRVVIDAFQARIDAEMISFDIIAGLETAGIPHSAALAYALKRPSVFVRKQAKEHGTRSRVEGGPVAGQRVLLIEDLVTTGGSSLSGVEALRSEGAAVTDCLAIVSYGFPEAAQAFADANVRLRALTHFDAILAQAGHFSISQSETIHEWLADPHAWSDRQEAM
jgi:orotate phosphoribosyltransferase